MHEAGIASSILEIAEIVARQHDAAPIAKIHLRLGTFTGVDRDSLQFAFDALRGETLARDAILEIESVPLVIRCPNCQLTGPPIEDYCLVCPVCHAPAGIVSGSEMLVAYVDLGETRDGKNPCGNQSPQPQRRDRGGEPAAI
jgi:hydrogenase nickel incorporation protein HypA/HybF